MRIHSSILISIAMWTVACDENEPVEIPIEQDPVEGSDTAIEDDPDLEEDTGIEADSGDEDSGGEDTGEAEDTGEEAIEPLLDPVAV
ncbi:MAG: hypothetical protein AAFV53_29915, partial [Myxococcota bacterium]